jgi:hypothetical protein
VPVAPTVFLLEGLVEDLQMFGCKPVHNLLAAWVVVIAGDVALGDFAADSG